MSLFQSFVRGLQNYGYSAILLALLLTNGLKTGIMRAYRRTLSLNINDF